jgi:hypothetical protein
LQKADGEQEGKRDRKVQAKGQEIGIIETATQEVKKETA